MCDHSSRDTVAIALKQPTRTTGRRMPYAVPIRFCSRWGLPCRVCYQKRGALLPHRFDLTAARNAGGLFSVALSLKSPLAGSYPAPFLAGARTFLPYAVTHMAAVARPSGAVSYSSCRLRFPSSSAKSIARHSPSMTPSIFSGRNRRWNATTAARPSAMP